ncbi:hypothetical protein B0T26DRAFT_757170 [Lasiosphaeria miniovina]|uniref:Uncharacterized protein n=1 Tax=Lasiosphaeria miniovina TaxID=1954250 RepID=A0AA39ZU93_9PEZI|nr:uncharacterized protein B0T26DRAFT_757170 [Lasiosphaeria miniovina]KAK0703644.1 hypothetical protein B0T26DRAFT_757170 [Lasiosphaeria miniovina]
MPATLGLAKQRSRSRRRAFSASLGQRQTIAGLVKHHLRLGNGPGLVCAVAPRERWIRGGFNTCIPVRVGSQRSAQPSSPKGETTLIFRCVMTHKLAEGTVDEKLSCEVGTHVWMQDHTRSDAVSALSLATQASLRPTPHTRPTATCADPTAYTLLEYISPATGRMLSTTWAAQRDDTARQRRLFRGLSRTMLSLARVPQPRIGSFPFDAADRTVVLANRPLLCCAAILESEGAPLAVNETYNCVKPFVADVLALHDRHFLADAVD